VGTRILAQLRELSPDTAMRLVGGEVIISTR